MRKGMQARGSLGYQHQGPGPQLRGVSKRVAARVFQLLNRHAMIAPFVKEKWGWTDRDTCRWYDKGRQSREHLFKECTLGKRKYENFGQRLERRVESRESALKSRKGFGFRVRKARARPSNTPIRDLLSDDRYKEAVLVFLGATRVGAICT